ncbi:hypothetical protein [Thermococcus pacificus]|uniref:Uncharacterized protein n=1 Tax=Thermococcus pacificus TaxID=71998 RepID=A0A218P5H9_9EURY|nr:hypothetical protein [Thermococcus pacificus]ASJ06032.1 hypothetical protein A3L08_01130 [Thermococcus pacificus]
MRKFIFALLAVTLLVTVAGCENPDTNVSTEKTLTINEVTVHYSGDVSLSQAKAVLNFVRDNFQINGETDVYVSKSGDSYTVTVTTPYESAGDIDKETAFYVKIMASKMSQDVFNGAKVTLKLLNGDEEEIFSAESKYAYIESNGITVWYAGVSEDDAQKVLDYAVSVAGSGPWDIFIDGSNPYTIGAMSSFNSADEIGDAESIYQEMAADLSERLGGNLVLRVLNPSGEEIARFTS